VSEKTKQAMETIKQAMVDDNPSEPGSYAHGWHCNIAMMCMDAILDAYKETPEFHRIDAHKVGNDAASRFMRWCCDVETKNN